MCLLCFNACNLNVAISDCAQVPFPCRLGRVLRNTLKEQGLSRYRRQRGGVLIDRKNVPRAVGLFSIHAPRIPETTQPGELK